MDSMVLAFEEFSGNEVLSLENQFVLKIGRLTW